MRKRHGFTLVELIIVIAVIGVLAAILIPTFSNVIDKANAKSALSDARNIVSQFVADKIEDDTLGGSKNLPENIVIVINKANKFYLYGYNTAGNGELLKANNGEGFSKDPAGMPLKTIDDFLTSKLLFNNVHPGEQVDASKDDYKIEEDGAVYLAPYNSQGEQTGSVKVKGFVPAKDGNQYRELSNEMDKTFGKNSYAYHGILLNGTFTVDSDNGQGEGGQGEGGQGEGGQGGQGEGGQGGQGEGGQGGQGEGGQGGQDIPGETTYTITFSTGTENSSNVSNMPADIRNIAYDCSAVIPSDIPTTTSDGFSFINWIYNDKQYNPGDTISNVKSDITLTAVWSDYIQIKTEEDLDNVRNNLNGKYIVVNDIVLTGEFLTIGWTSDDDQPFTGIFDGNNHTVSNLNINKQNYNTGGLFAINKGDISNLNLVVGKIRLSYFVGSIAGKSYGSITNVHVTINDQITAENANSNGQSGVGGLVGRVEGGIISKCSVTGILHGYHSYASGNGTMLGGIAGRLATGAKIQESWFCGYINKDAESNNLGVDFPYGGKWIGGIAGYSDGTIENCWAYNKQLYGYDEIGGIAGAGDTNGAIRNSWAYTKKCWPYSNDENGTGRISTKNADSSCYSQQDCSAADWWYDGITSRDGTIIDQLKGATAADCPLLDTTIWHFASNKYPELINNPGQPSI